MENYWTKQRQSKAFWTLLIFLCLLLGALLGFASLVAIGFVSINSLWCGALVMANGLTIGLIFTANYYLQSTLPELEEKAINSIQKMRWLSKHPSLVRVLTIYAVVLILPALFSVAIVIGTLRGGSIVNSVMTVLVVLNFFGLLLFPLCATFASVQIGLFTTGTFLAILWDHYNLRKLAAMSEGQSQLDLKYNETLVLCIEIPAFLACLPFVFLIVDYLIHLQK